MSAPRSAVFVPVVAFVFAMALIPSGLDGQAPTLEPGARVRLTQSSGERHEGTLQAIGSDSARLTGSRGTLVSVPLSDLSRIEVSLGRRRQFWKHLGLTAVGLAVLGGAAGGASYEPCDESVLFGCLLSPGSQGEAFAWGAMLGGVVGVPAGIVVGAAVRREEWAPVQREGVQPRQVPVRPTLGRGVGLAATVTLR